MKTTEEHMRDIHNQGAQYIDTLGLSIMATQIDNKHPVQKWQEKQTTPVTLDEFETWIEHGAPTVKNGNIIPFNIAIITGATSGVVVVDCDDEKAVLKCKELGIWSPIRANTRRGKHLYFRHPGYHVKTVANAIGYQNIDVRGDGGYVLAPPSMSKRSEIAMYYTWDIDPGCEWDDMPVLPDLSVHHQGSAGPEVRSDGSIDLSGVNPLGTKQEGPSSIWEHMSLIVAEKGQLAEGDGRNQWLVRYVGEQLARGVTGEELRKTAADFVNQFYADALPDEEVERSIKSIEDRDRRRNPHKYAADGTRTVQRPATDPTAQPVFTPPKFEILNSGSKTYIKPPECLMHPIIHAESIQQIHGHSGAGKSMLAQSMCWNLSIGKDWGPYSAMRKAKVLYLDYENSKPEILKRIRQFEKMYGPSEEIAIIATDDLPGGVQLNNDLGRNEFNYLLEQINPEIVVIDTVRSAWPGLDETQAWAWSSFNGFCKELRDKKKKSVIWLHHSNKPTQEGIGREAGSTAQLNLLDMQVQVIKIFGAKETPEMKEDERAALADELKRAAHSKGGLVHQYGWNVLNTFAEDRGERIIDDWSIKVEVGKNRSGISGTRGAYIGWTEHAGTGERGVVATEGALQCARRLSETHTMDRIAKEAGMPISDLRALLDD